MNDIHLTRDLLRAVADGNLPPAVLVRIGLEHLFSLCAECSAEYQAFKRSLGSRQPDSEYEQAFDQVYDLIGASAPSAAESVNALSELEALRSDRELQERLLNGTYDQAGFSSSGLSSLLLEESHTRLLQDAATAELLLRLAEIVHQRCSAFDPITATRLAAHQGNLERSIRQDFVEANRRFDQARRLLAKHEVADPMVWAEVDRLEASLRRDENRYQEAEELLVRAAAVYKISGESVQAAIVLIKLGTVYDHSGSIKDGIEATEEALAQLDELGQDKLAAHARFNLASLLCAGGRGQEADSLLASLRKDYLQYFPAETARFLLLEAKVDSACCRQKQAEEHLLLARAGFIEQGLPCDAALASLDLAVLCLDQGRTAEATQIAAEILPLFQAYEIERETLSVLLLLHKAAEAESLTRVGLQEAIRLLEQANRRPRSKSLPS